jgi:hypothetical protein
MSSPTEFLGKRFTARIGEPWDFRTDAGDNRLVGEISEISDPNSSHDWIRVQVAPFSLNGAIITELVCASRYARGATFFQELPSDKGVVCNLYFARDGSHISPQEDLKIPVDSRYSFLVGTLSLQGN